MISVITVTQNMMRTHHLEQAILARCILTDGLGWGSDVQIVRVFRVPFNGTSRPTAPKAKQMIFICTIV